MQVNEYYIPAVQTYNTIEPAFTTCGGPDDYVIPVAWGAISRVIGECQAYRGDVGQCLGTFHSQDVDTRDTPWGCLATAVNSSNVCRVGTNTQATVSSSSLQPASQKKVQDDQSLLRSLKDKDTQPIVMSRATLTTEKGKPNNAQAANLFMSPDVFDSPFLKRGLQSTSDPAGWLAGIPSYTNLRQQAEASTMTANEPWGACSSYGNYSAAPNATLTSNNKCSGNCVLGQYA
jgi:hypothetical protein